MDKKLAFKNLASSLLLNLLTLLVGTIVRASLINFLGNEYLGFYTLFISLIGVISLIEFGFGSAIMFSMYKPIINNDKEHLSALYHLMDKIYRIIFFLFILVAFFISLFLEDLSKDSTVSNEIIYVSFWIFVISSSLQYFFMPKFIFINAHMDNHITNSFKFYFKLLEAILQLLFIYVTKSFELFLLVFFVTNLLQLILTNFYFKRKYSLRVNSNKILLREQKIEIIQKSKAMFSHKVGYTIVFTIENILISSLIGISILGLYSNYLFIINGVIGILSIIFSSLTSNFGHVFAKSHYKNFFSYFERMYYLNYLLAFVFFLGYSSIITELITIIFGEELLLDRQISYFISLSFFIQFLRQAVLNFKDASGTFYNDRFKPYIEGIIHLILSVIFIRVFGLIGALYSSIFTNIFITHLIEPYVLFKYAFKVNPIKFILKNYFLIFIFSSVLFSSSLINYYNYDNTYLNLLMNGSISIFVSFLVFSIIFLFDYKARLNIVWLFNILLKTINAKFQKQ
jgi:O-antigen/teichoic acid export membrane protein